MQNRRASRVVFGAVLAVLLPSFQPALADTFTSYVLATSSGSVDNIGLTSSGTLVFLSTSAFPNPIYTTFTPPSTFSTSIMPPTLVFDNGTACAATNTGAYSSVGPARCNGSFQVFQAAVGGSSHFSLFNGPDPVANLVSNRAAGGYTNFLINSRGDIAVVAVTVPSVNADENLLFIRAATTPEPSSLAMLGTGLLSAVAVARRRWRLR